MRRSKLAEGRHAVPLTCLTLHIGDLHAGCFIVQVAHLGTGLVCPPFSGEFFLSAATGGLVTASTLFYVALLQISPECL